MHYINFYFKNLTYDNSFFRGEFSAPDNDVYCEFEYDRNSEQWHIWNNNKPAEEILPLPVYWLIFKLEKNGKLNSSESKICW